MCSDNFDYIFSDPCEPIGGGTRWSWVDGYLSDLEVFLQGLEGCSDGRSLTFSILICSAIDFISDLYAGDTEYRHCKKLTKAKTCQHSNQTTPAKRCQCNLDHTNFEQAIVACDFIKDFFDGIAAQIPHLIWDGLRNGMTHTSMPKQFKLGNRKLGFVFFGAKSNCGLLRIDDRAKIIFGARGLLDALKRAVDRYKGRLESEPDLQAKFRIAWGSIENYTRTIRAGSQYEIEMSLLFKGGDLDKVPLFDRSITL